MAAASISPTDNIYARSSPSAANMSDREDYFHFLDLPAGKQRSSRPHVVTSLTTRAEFRHHIYEFAAESEANEPRCVLPCLVLTLVYR
jgi:hypothetical protein